MRPGALILAIALSLAPAARAQSQAEVAASARDAYEMAHSFAECAGYWDFFSTLEASLGNRASAEHVHNIGNGARLSAGYMLSMRHRLESPTEPPRSYGSWDDFIEPLAEVTATRMMAAVEREDMAPVREQAMLCTALGETSQAIVDQMRFENTSRQ